MTPDQKTTPKANNYQTSNAIAAIIPAYNEQAGIRSVLSILTQVVEIQEIIVVNDGSKDSTEDIVTQAIQLDNRIRLINHQMNQGKGYAIFSGLKATSAPIIITIDADLLNLTPAHIRALIRPVVEYQAEMTLGVFFHGQWNTDFSHKFTPWLSGQRCLRADKFSFVDQVASAGYGIETALTVAARKNDWRVIQVRWEGVSHPPSEFHRGVWGGFKNRVRMYAHILRAWYLANRYQRVVDRVKIRLGIFT
jgi:glycosyltransferase involved in cell wall biosynthesis